MHVIFSRALPFAITFDPVGIQVDSENIAPTALNVIARCSAPGKKALNRQAPTERNESVAENEHLNLEQ